MMNDFHTIIVGLLVLLILLLAYAFSSSKSNSKNENKTTKDKEEFKEYKVVGLNRDKSINVLKLPPKAELMKRIERTKVFSPKDAELLGSFLEVQKEPEMTLKDLSFIGIEAAASDNLYAHVQRTEIDMVTQDDVRARFNTCLQDPENTVKSCLTYSQAGLYPGLCRRLAGSIYGQLSAYTGKLCNQLMQQQRTSCYAGAC